MTKNCLYFLAVWVMFNNGQIWKYPQAWGWMNGGPAYAKDYRKKTFILDCNSSQDVVEIPQYKVKKIGFHMKEAEDQGYFIFRNPSCLDSGGKPIYSDECEIVLINGVRTTRDTTGKNYMPPAKVFYRTLLGVLK